MFEEPAWTRCLHLSAGTCPHMNTSPQGFDGGDSPMPVLTQDLALQRLGEACENCVLSPDREEGS